jgi:hypothetical protein
VIESRGLIGERMLEVASQAGLFGMQCMTYGQKGTLDCEIAVWGRLCGG